MSDVKSARGRRRLVAALVAVLAVTAAACGDDSDEGTSDTTVTTEAGREAPSSGSADWDAVVAQAEEEGSVTYYSTQNLPNVEAMEKAFESAYPEIDMTIVRGLPNDLHPRLETEASTGQGEADVYTTADVRWVADKDTEGFFTAVTGPNFDSDDFDRDKYNPDGTWFVSHAATIGYGWNTELFPDGLTGYEDLLTDELAGGKIGIIEPGGEAQLDWYTYIEEEFGAEYLEELAALEPRIYAGGTAVIEALTSGEIFATPYASPTIRAAIESGAPLDWALPDTAWGTLFDSVVLESAPHPAAAQVLADFMLTEEGQTALATDYVAVMPGIETSLVEIDAIRSQPGALTPEAVTAGQEAWRELFQ
jgi:iron(III) transport system substrate-binding protein